MAANNPLFDFSQPRVMAILNVTPDSFFAGSRMPDAPHVERRVREAVAEGASIIDVGGYSSRPGADEVSPGEEWRRVKLGVGAVRRLAPGMAVSVDTFRSEVAARAIERFGPLIINDISAGELDPAMPAVAAKYGVPYIAMHMKGDPKTMQSLTDYKRDITRSSPISRPGLPRCSPPGSHASISSSIPVSASPRPRNRITNCSPGFTASVRWAIPYWRGSRASR